MAQVNKLMYSEVVHHSWLMYLVTGFVLMGCYFFVGMKNVSLEASTLIIERFLPFIGILSIGLMFTTEAQATKEVLMMRHKALEKLYVVRLVYRLVFTLFTEGMYAYFLYVPNSTYSFREVLLYLVGMTLFLGGSSLCVYALSQSSIMTAFYLVFYMLIQWLWRPVGDHFLYLYNLANFNQEYIMGRTLLGILLLLFSIRYNARTLQDH